MDPSIIKILEDDEDETMHSGADVEAFTAALNRDMEGDAFTSPQTLESDGVVLSQGGNHTSREMFSQWQSSSQNEIRNDHSHQRQNEPNNMQQHMKHNSEIDQKQHNSGADGQQQQAEQISPQFSQPTGVQGRMHNPENDAHNVRLQRMNNQPVAGKVHQIGPPNQAAQVPFGLLLPVITPQLDKDRALKLHQLYKRLKNNEIPKEGFVRHMKAIVGDQMLKQAVMQIQLTHNQSRAAGKQSNLKIPPSSATQPTEPQSDSHGMQASQMTSSVLIKSNQDREHSTTPIQGLNKQQQQHVHFPPTSFPMYGSSGGSYHPLKPQGHDLQIRQPPVHQNMGPANVGGSTQAMNMASAPKFEGQSSVNDSMRVQGGTFSHLKNNAPTSSLSYVKQEPVDQANKSQSSMPQGLQSISTLKVEQGSSIAGALMEEFTEKQSSRAMLPSSMSMLTSNSTSSSMSAQLDPNASLGSRMPSELGVNVKTLPKKPPIIGQKKPIEGLGSSPPSSKKQKVSGGYPDQSIEQLNDVTAVSGVNLREEEEQLFSGPKDSRVSEASRRFVQEEEERLILQKAPLQKKLKEIMAKCGVNNLGKDVERCLSLCVEERMRGLISNLIRLSKQRVDTEKSRHQTFITSDVRHQILMVNRRAKEEWERKQAEEEKLRKLNEPEDNGGIDGEKDDGRGKTVKVNKEEDDKMRTTAANVAARAAVGGDDMLSKWQLMAEQNRQKREGTTDGPSTSQPSKETQKPSSSSGKGAKDNQELEKKAHSSILASSGGLRKHGRNQVIIPQTKVARNLSVKDVIAVLEREPQMSKSTLIYRLYDKLRSKASVD